MSERGSDFSGVIKQISDETELESRLGKQSNKVNKIGKIWKTQSTDNLKCTLIIINKSKPNTL